MYSDIAAITPGRPTCSWPSVNITGKRRGRDLAAGQVPAHGRYWADLASPLFVTGGAIFVLIRRAEIAWAVAASMQPAAPASAPVR